jgi:putative phosphoribosyl transferase
VASDLDAESVRISADGTVLVGDLTLPGTPEWVVLFAHGSGSSRHSPRNRYVAEALNRAGFGTLLMDLLTPDEEHVDLRTRELRFDIPRLASRLTAAVDWLAAHSPTVAMPVILFGASTGAAAALITAAQRPTRVRGVISRGGRPDLAGGAVDGVRAPTLLIAGGNDATVRQLDEATAARLRAGGTDVREVVVPGATHLFEEPGALDAVIEATLDRLHAWARD